MSKVSYVDLTTPQEQFFYQNLQPQDRLLFARITKKTSIFSPRKIKNLTAISLLPQIAAAWNVLTAPQKAAWTTAGATSGLNGYRAFVAEQSIRLKLGMSFPNLPSNYHVGWFGRLSVSSPATQIKIAQYHPASYYVLHKVPGTKSQYSPVAVQEPLTLPFLIGLSYRTNLTAIGGSKYAKFYAAVRCSYQGVTYYQNLEIDLDEITDWKSITATLSSVLGYVVDYVLYFHIYGYTGDVYFDNVKATHGAVNWARDKNCNDINISFTRAYYQIPKNWVAIELPSGALYDSDYKDF